MAELKLSLLKCLNCGEPLPPGDSHFFFFCHGCNHGVHLQDGRLEEVKTEFREMQAVSSGTEKALPFWTFDTEIRISYRDAGATAGSFLKTFMEIGREPSTDGFLAGGGRTLFFVPAFNLDLEKAKNLGKQMTLGQLVLRESRPQPFEAVTLSCEDAKILGEYIFLSAEIELPDTARSISYIFKPENPGMKIIRFRK